MLNRRFHNKKGFTLIELVVVILIIGILAAVASVALVGVLKKNTLRTEKAAIETAFTTCQSFMTEVNGNFSNITPGLSHFSQRIPITGGVKNAGDITAPTLDDAEGLYIRCIRKDEDSKEYSVPIIWYIIKGRLWTASASGITCVDSKGTVTVPN